MKIGVSAFAWTTRIEQSHLDMLAGLGEHGIDGFEIPMFDPAEIDASATRRAFEAGGLESTVCAILPAGVNPISPDASLRKSSLAHLVRCIQTTAALGAQRIGGPLFAPIGYLPGRRRNRDEINWAVECFQALGNILDANKVNLAIEPVNRSETFFLNTASEAGSLCDAIAHPRIGVLIDTFHANIEEKNIAAAVRSLGTRLTHLHASENDRGLLGSGHVDFPGIVAALKEVSYDGYLMIEGFGYSPKEASSFGALWGDLAVSPEDIAFQGAAYLRGLLSDTSE